MEVALIVLLGCLLAVQIGRLVMDCLNFKAIRDIKNKLK